MMPMRTLASLTATFVVGLVAALAFAGAASQEQTASEEATPGPPAGPRNLVSALHGGGNAPAPVGATADTTKAQSSVGRGNPLWGIPLESLTATRERPIFSPTRRAQVVELASVQPRRSQAVEQPGRPPLSLIGVITGETEGIAILLDETTKGIVRLRTGEGHSGWTLQSANGREATLQKGRQTAILALPNPSAK